MQQRSPHPNRRDVIQTAIATAAATGLATRSAAEENAETTSFIDTNVHLFHWPFRRLPLDASDRLVDKLRDLGIGRAWAGSFEGLLHRDLAAVNDRLVAACGVYPELVPIGTINVNLPGWEDDLDQCLQRHRMPAVRLFPNYHGYDLNDARFGDLLRRASKAGCLVQIAVAMEDTRTQHPLVRVEDVDSGPLKDWLAKVPDVRVQLLGHRLRGNALKHLAPLESVLFDTARVDGTDSIAHLLDSVGTDRVMYGSHSPFLIPEAALIRVYESRLDDAAVLSVMKTTAERFVPAS